MTPTLLHARVAFTKVSVQNFELTTKAFSLILNLGRFGRMQYLFGALAQLGERLHGMEEVESSILLRSTKRSLDAHPSDTRIERAVCVEVCYH